MMPHAPYSPEPITPDHHLFYSSKEGLHGCHYEDYMLKNAVQQWLDTNKKDFHRVGLYALVQHWEKTLEKVGNYITK
jgi:hypothetical protein